VSYQYYRNCCGWPEGDVDAEGGLCDMIDEAKDITRKTFLRHVDYEKELWPIEYQLSYDRYHKQGMTMASDWHVSYHKSKLHGLTVYYFKHSRVEYVFVPPRKTLREQHAEIS